MTREEATNHLKDILAEATETEHAVCYVTNEDAEALEMAIEALQAQKTGRWIIFPPCFEEICMCSNCKTKFKEAYQHRDTCPSCGARMECEDNV